MTGLNSQVELAGEDWGVRMSTGLQKVCFSEEEVGKDILVAWSFAPEILGVS